MSKGSEQTRLQRGHTDGQKTYEKMLSVTGLGQMQIKTLMRYHLTPVKMAIINKSTSVGEDVEKREPSGTVGGNADWCSHSGKTVRN